MRTEVFDIADYTDEQFDLFYSVMDESRKEKADRYKSESNRKLCILADYAARKMISEETGLSPDDIIFGCDSLGKPYAANADIFFSISHSGTLAVCAVSDLPVGADIEEISEKPLRILGKFACVSEKEFIGSDAGRATLVWTLKEAYFKAKGTGIASGLKTVSFDIIEDTVKCSDSGYICCSTPVKNNYVLSVCVGKQQAASESIAAK